MSIRHLMIRFLGFSALPLLSALTPLVLLPLIARLGGPQGWASVTVAQTIGVFAGVVTSFGTNVAGSAQAALADGESARHDLYASSFWARFPIFIVTSAVGGAAAAMLAAPGFVLDSILMCIGMSVSGLSLGWYGIGVASPRLLFRYEALPRATFAILTIPLLSFTHRIFVYPLALIIGTSLGLLRFHVALFGKGLPPLPRSPGPVKTLSANFKFAVTDVCGAAYVSAPLPIVASMSLSSATASFASVNQVFRYGLFVIVASSNTLQTWVLVRSGREPRAKQLAAIGVHALIGGCGFLGLWFGGALVTRVLFGPRLAGTSAVLFWYGVSYFAVSVSAPLIRNVLIPSARGRLVMVAATVAALVGLTGMLTFGHSGPTAVAASYAMSEVLVLFMLAWPSAQLLRRLPATESH